MTIGKFDPSVVKPSLRDPNDPTKLRSNLVTDSYGSGAPDAVGELRESLTDPNDRSKLRDSLLDSSGELKAGLRSGSVLVTGGRAFEYDGVDDYVSGTSKSYAGDFTFACWITRGGTRYYALQPMSGTSLISHVKDFPN